MALTSTYKLLVIAANLTVLTYYLGVLIYALPVPSRRVKKWAPLLIEDSIYAAIMILLFAVILYASDYIAAFSGTTLAEVANWIKSSMHKEVFTYVIGRLATIPLYLLPVGGGIIASIAILPLMLTFYGVITASASLLIPLYVIMKLKSILTALGLALYALPFRIGKNIGASLIAFIVIGNIVFHFLPAWMQLVQSIVEGEDSNVNVTYMSISPKVGDGSVPAYNAWGLVKDRHGNTPIYAILFLTELRTNITLSYLVQPDGGFYTIDNGIAIPAGRYNATIEYMGVKLQPLNNIISIPTDLKLTYEYSDMPYRIDFTVHNALFLPQQAVLVSSCFIERYTIKVQDDAVNVTLTCSSSPYTSQTIVLAAPSSYGIVDISVDKLASALKTWSYSKPWRGVDVHQLIARFVPYTSPYSVIIVYRLDEALYEPIVGSGSTVGAASASEGPVLTFSWDTLFKTVDFVTPILIKSVAYTVAAFSFLTILSSLTIGFARFIGAYSPRMVFEP